MAALAYHDSVDRKQFLSHDLRTAAHRTTKTFNSVAICHQREIEDHEYNLPQRVAETPRSNTWVMSIIKHGQLTLSGQSGSTVVRSGDCVIFCADWLQAAKCESAAGKKFEQTYIVISELLLEVQKSSPILFLLHSAPCSEIKIAAKLTEVLLETKIRTLRETQSTIADAVAALLTNAISRGSASSIKPPIADTHFQNVSRYIQIQLSNPQLCVQKVSVACEISPRYLSHILRSKGTSYSELVWGQRLEKAREWLSAPQEYNNPISEIAFSLGFKSAAHFTRLFKKHYGERPTQCRTSASERLRAPKSQRHLSWF